MSTFFEHATGLPLLPADEANEQVVTLSFRNSILERAARQAGLNCYFRISGFCFSECVGRVICDVSGLTILPTKELPERFKELLNV